MKAPFTHANPKGGKAPKHNHFTNNQPPFGSKKKPPRVPKPAPAKLPKSLNELIEK